MTIDWHAFTPFSALLGGALIGLSAVIYILGNGRVAGISGIVGAFVTRRDAFKDMARVGFVVGLIAAPWAWQVVAPLPSAKLDVGMLGVVLAGALVGVGVRMGQGCTSGHGVCGLSRFSLRSLVNVCAFMGAGFVMVYVLRHLIG
jgi:uncharacterized protein